MHNLPWKDVLEHAPLAAFGMVIGQADLMLQQIPMIVKVMTITALSVGAFYDIKTDLRVLQSEVVHAGAERAEFRAFMSKGGRCTSEDCMDIRKRVRDLEAINRERG